VQSRFSPPEDIEHCPIDTYLTGWEWSQKNSEMVSTGIGRIVSAKILLMAGALEL